MSTTESSPPNNALPPPTLSPPNPTEHLPPILEEEPILQTDNQSFVRPPPPPQQESHPTSSRRRLNDDEWLSYEVTHQHMFSYLWKRCWTLSSPWFFIVILVQTILLCTKLGLRHMQVSSVLSFFASWFLVFSPSWICCAILFLSVGLWMIGDVLRVVRRYLRQRRRRRRTTDTFTRSKRIEYLHRFFAISFLTGLVLFITLSILLSLRLDGFLSIPFIALTTPVLVYAMVVSASGALLSTIFWRRIVQNGAATAFHYLTSTLAFIAVLLLFALKLDGKHITAYVVFLPWSLESLVIAASAVRYIFWTFHAIRYSNIAGYNGKYLYHTLPLPMYTSWMTFASLLHTEINFSRRFFDIKRTYHLRRTRLDSVVLIAIQIPLNVFLVLLAYYWESSTLSTVQVLIAFIPLLVALATVCCWLVSRERVMQLLYPHESEVESSTSNREESGSVANPSDQQSTEQQQIERNNENIHRMILALHRVLNSREVMERENPSSRETALMSWLQHVQRFEAANRMEENPGFPTHMLFPLNELRRAVPAGVSAHVLEMLPTYAFQGKSNGPKESYVL
jgi:hypothetical protein